MQEPKDNKWAIVPAERVKSLYVRLLEAGVNLAEAAPNVGITPRHLELMFQGEVPMKEYTRYLLELIILHPQHQPKPFPGPPRRGAKVAVTVEEEEDEF